MGNALQACIRVGRVHTDWRRRGAIVILPRFYWVVANHMRRRVIRTACDHGQMTHCWKLISDTNDQIPSLRHIGRVA